LNVHNVGLIDVDKIIVGEDIADPGFLQPVVNSVAWLQDLDSKVPLEGAFPRQPNLAK
jgi:hypothetical protein